MLRFENKFTNRTLLTASSTLPTNTYTRGLEDADPEPLRKPVEIRSENIELGCSDVFDLAWPKTSYLTRMIQPKQPVVCFVHRIVWEPLPREGRQLTVSCAQNAVDTNNHFFNPIRYVCSADACGTKQSPKYNQVDMRHNI